MVSEKMKNIYSGIRGELYFTALEKEKNGEKVLKLNTGNPAAFGFEMPKSVKEKLMSSLDAALGYCDLRGMAAARNRIYEYHKGLGVNAFSPDDIFVTNGVSEGSNMAISVLCDEGDEFLLPTPCYSLWVNMIKLFGGKCVFYDCDEDNGWMPSIEDIRSKVTDKTKAVLLINPNNPTGAVYSREIVESVYKLACEKNIVILSDEIYDRILIDGAVHTPTASLGNEAVVMTFNGLSKSHCLCGFRCGWIVVSGPEAERNAISTALGSLAAARLCSNALMQLVIPTSLDDFDYTKEMISEGGRIYEQSRAAYEAFCKIDGIKVVKNGAAFYQFPKIELEKFNIESDKDFAKKLLEEENILVVAGSGFYAKDNAHFRIVALPTAQEITDAIERIGKMLDRYRK
jgi:alanine-synthesizing transaminase